MIHLITGGSASGKSAYAEQKAMEAGAVRYYIATMEPFGEEGRQRIKKHRAMREGKGFRTIECWHHLDQVQLEAAKDSVVLLECMTNLVANEQFSVGGSDDEIISRIRDGVNHLTRQASHLIIVTGEVFSDGIEYEEETGRYLYLLGRVDQEMAQLADRVTEVVYGIPIHMKKNSQKGEKPKTGRWESFVIAFSMYSRIPMPQIPWSEGGMKYALCFFPLVGVVIGAVMCVFFWLSWKLPLGETARACLGTAIPLLITGGIHMDGFLDTADARSSFQPREKKLEILKDPHSGAFAVIGCGVYLLLYLAAFSELGEHAFPAGAGIYVLARAVSGWSVVSLPKAKKDGLASTFSTQAHHRTVQAAMVCYGTAAAVWMIAFAGVRTGLVMLLGALSCALWYCRMSRKEFGGVTGDLAGYFLQVCELTMLAVLAVFM